LVTADQSYALIDSTFENNHACTVHGINPNITSLGVFTNHFWLTTVRLHHASEGMGCSKVSGLDFCGNTLSLSFNSTGTITGVSNVIAYTYAEMTNILQVGAGRQISIIY
jgi:hypothetical protein